MKGRINNMNENYALIKLPDGRTINVRADKLPKHAKKDAEVDLYGEIPPTTD